MDKYSHKFRASYSVLNCWKSGNWEMAVKMYFKLEHFITPAMADGREHHAGWENYIATNKALPVEFGGKKLQNPEVEKKMVVSVNDWMDLVGIIDCIDIPTIYEFKTGKTSSEQYAADLQLGVYGLLATLSGIYIDRAELHHYDQYTKRHDVSYVWLTDNLLANAHNWLITLGGEMHNYFLTNDLYQKLGGKNATN